MAADLLYIVDDNGEMRFLGNIEPKDVQVKAKWPVYGDTATTPLIPKSKWDDYCITIDQAIESFFLPPVHDQNGVGMCFPKGTLIKMADGSNKPIEDIKVLDEVVSAEGNIKKVLHTMVRVEKEEIYQLKVWGHRHLKATAEHPILTKRGYVKISELNEDDFIAIPKFKYNNKNYLHLYDYINTTKVHTSRAKSNREVGIPGKVSTIIVRHKPPEVLDMTYELGWIIGLFLAEGCTSSGKVTWCLSLDEFDTLGKRLVNYIKDVFGAEASIKTKPLNNTTIVRLYGTWWVDLFDKLCNKFSYGKYVHKDLMQGNNDFLKGVLDGWTDGDGIGDDFNGGVTVSHHLAIDMFDIANMLGYAPTIETLDVKINPKHNIKQRRKRYIVRWGKTTNTTHTRQQDDKYLWRRVDTVIKETFNDYVFNLEVEDDHSYIAEGIGVHNCNASATTAAMEARRAKQSLDYIKLSSGDLYGRINGGYDGGSLLEDGLRESMNKGVSSINTVPYLEWRNISNGAVERPKYRVLEAFLCPTFEHVFSAAAGGCDIISGILWYSNYTPDSDGWLPSPYGQAGGHAVYGFAPTKRGNTYGIIHQNSWGQWGYKRRGFCVFPESVYNNAIGGWWAVRSVVDEGGVVPGS